MKIYLISVIIGIVASFVSCDKPVSSQDRKDGNNSSSNVVVEKEKNDASYKDHYWEGLRIKNNGIFPDDMPKAIEQFQKASELATNETDRATAYNRIIELAISLKSYEKAEIYLRKLKELDPKVQGISAQAYLARILIWNLGKYEEGLKEANIVAETDKTIIAKVIEKTVGRAYEGLGDYPNAIKHYEKWLNFSKTPSAVEDKKVKKQVNELKKIVKSKSGERIEPLTEEKTDTL
jgi:tetratricopeptide (TPR) repeat protein